MHDLKKTSKYSLFLVFGILFIIAFNLLFYFFIIQDHLKTTTPSPSLSEGEYLQEKAKYIQLSNRSDPRAALNQMQEDIKSNDALARSCHILTHEIGHYAYQRYKSFGKALAFSNEICNSGYLHGVIESHFLQESDVLSKMEMVCDDLKENSFTAWQCYHGVGHGLMLFTTNDLNLSLEYCKKFSYDFARSNCVNGIFMENFNTEQKIHPSKYLKHEDPFYPCNEQKVSYKEHCYYYAPTYYLSFSKNTYEGAIQECMKIEGDYGRSCISGVGGQMMKENINNPRFVERICLEYAGTAVELCITGMVSIYINHFASWQAGEALCQKMDPQLLETCNALVERKKAEFL